MVDAIGTKAVTGGERIVRATPAAPVQTVRPDDRAATASPTVAAGSLAKSLATAAPVDTDRVAVVKRAIAEGTYPILPGKIADALIAARLQWISDDQA